MAAHVARRRILRRSRTAFTLLEAMLAISLTAVAGGAMMLGIASAATSTQDAVDLTIAQGMAQQLIDEIAGKRYSAPGAGGYQLPLSPNAYEEAGVDRERYDDLDDYVAYSCSPPKDQWGVLLGADNGVGGTRHSALQATSAFSSWSVQVQVYYARNTNLSQAASSGTTSNFRAIEVKVFKTDPLRGQKLITSLRRVVAYIPNPNT